MHIHISPLRKTISSFPSEKNPSVPITVRLHTAELTQPPEDPRAPYAPTCPRRSSARSPALRQPSLSPAARSGRAPAPPGSRLPPPLPRVVSTAPPRGSARRSAGYPRPAIRGRQRQRAGPLPARAAPAARLGSAPLGAAPLPPQPAAGCREGAAPSPAGAGRAHLSGCSATGGKEGGASAAREESGGARGARAAPHSRAAA